MSNMWITIISCFGSSPDDGGYHDTEYNVEIQKESEFKDTRRDMTKSIDRDTVTQLSIIFQEKIKENKKMGVNVTVEQNTKNYIWIWR